MAAKDTELTPAMTAACNTLSTSALHAASPLWTRAPKRDEKGRAYSDFMLLIPGLRQQSPADRQICQALIGQSLKPFEESVVYVDLNINLSLLWVSHKPVPGITMALVQALQRVLPQARVIAGDFNIQSARDRQAPQGWLSMFGLRLKNSIRRLR